MGRAACLSVLLLAGCPTVDLGETPTDIGMCNPPGGLAYFETEIWPRYVVRADANASCNRVGCHITGGNGLDFPAAEDFPTAYRRTQAFLNCGTPMASLFLTKPVAGIEPHGGGDLFPNSDASVQVFLGWFE